MGFPKLNLTIIDGLPQCLGTLPAKAAAYCEKYMRKKGIGCFFSTFYKPEKEEFWQQIGYPEVPGKQGFYQRPTKTYVCIGVKASNYFMPEETLSEKGPGGGKWILIKKNLGVATRDGELWS